MVNEVVSSTERISDMVAQMATATEEQSVTSEDVSRNVHGISAVSNGLAAGVAQIARSTNGLNDLADGLGELVASFTVSEDPAAAGASPQRSMLLGDGSSGKVPAFALSGRSEG